ncbi:hypothetical protein BC830DRAFT_64515 [Chytriomyces sp. MP71]|nr:hypothetical protein BC830DRAFT_64515 [Chytriomyces sp. MP71]
MAALELRTLASELDKTCADSLQQRVTRQNEAIQSLVDERTTHLEIIAGLKGTFARLKTRVKDLVVENANLRVILIDYVEVLKGVRRRQDKLTAEELDTMKAFEEVHNRALTRAAARRKDNVNEARKSDNSSSLLKIKSLNRNESILSTSSSLPRIRSKTSHPYVKFFKALPLFAIFPEDMITQVAFASYEMKRKLGHIIVSKGEEAAEMFFLLRGNAQVLVDGKIVSTLNPGTFFGELGV